MYLERLQASLPEVRSRIGDACGRSGRPTTDPVRIVAVTKGHPVEAIQAVRELGLEVIGESRVQEAEAKREEVGGLGLEWHMIGHLQRNKVSRALNLFSLIHSVDSPRLAQEIGKEAEKGGERADVLVQVNTSGEESKYGFPLSEGRTAIEKITRIEGIRVVGLMTMAPLTTDEAVLRDVFQKTRALYERCSDEVQSFVPGYLSMGMTNDYEIAVEEGSNMVRLGTALFGERPL